MPAGSDRVLVVDTSSDYVDLVRRSRPGRALFITDPEIRRRAREEAPPAEEELLVDPDNADAVAARLRDHLARHDQRAVGVVSYGDEGMLLAALLAREFGLAYPSPEAIRACRCKPRAQALWRRAGLATAASQLCDTPDEAVRFLAELPNHRAIIKPLTGSGSELCFACTTPEECERAVTLLRRHVPGMTDPRLYVPLTGDSDHLDPHHAFTIEEFIEGPEYSCDFLVEDDRVELVRVARKWLKPGAVPGIALAYLTPAAPHGLEREALASQLRQAAHALGVKRALCMCDFIVQNGRFRPLELAPRPGGDCLPPLLLAACRLDIIGLALDRAAGLPAALPAAGQPLVGLRLFAAEAGTIVRLDADELRRDPRVVAVSLKRGPGHRVQMPPIHYDDWYLGYVLFRPGSEDTVEREYRELQARLQLDLAVAGVA